MKKAFLLVALSLCASVCAPTVQAQDFAPGVDPMTSYNSLSASVAYAQAKQRATQARSRERTRKARAARGTRRSRQSSLAKSGPRTRRYYRTLRRTTYRSRRYSGAKIMKISSALVAVVLCAMVCSPIAKAQDLGGVFDMGQLAQSLTIGATANAYAGRDAGHSKGKRAPSRRVVRQKAPPALRGSTRFRPSSTVRQRTLETLVAKVRAADPQSAAALQRDLSKADPIAAIAPGLARYGLRTDDVADATAAYLISAWYGVRGSNQDRARATVRATREQMRRALLSTRAFVPLSDATKQQMSDALLLQLMVTDSLITNAKGNSVQMTNAKRTICQGALSTFKLDLSKMKLTNQGLRA